MPRGFDVPLLRALVPATKENDSDITRPDEIDPIARSIMDTQFANAIANRSDVPFMTKGKPVQAGRNQSLAPFILQLPKPFLKCCRLL